MSDDKLAPDAPLDEVEWRIQGDVDGGGGVRVVAYLDAPTVSALLDEWVGPARWRDAYEPTGKDGVLWCHLDVKWDDEWVTKTDVGTSSNFEAEKGLVSDAFKRVAMRKWGVGRNVFALPVLRITRFRKVERNGNTQAYLTDESMADIRGMLERAGHDDAAQQTRVATVDAEDADEVTEPPAKPKSKVERAAELGVDWGALVEAYGGDVDKAVEIMRLKDGLAWAREHCPAGGGS